jgi:hypothetical protein
MRQEAPAVFPYLQLLEDASGIEPADISMRYVSSSTVQLLRVAASIYLPYLKANDQAVAANEQSFSLEVEGQRYDQTVFKYHAKCYRIIREKFAALDPAARLEVETALGSVELLS